MVDKIQQAIACVVQELYGETVRPQVSVPDEKFGDVATNVAMQLAGKLGKNPREIAEQVAEVIRKLPQVSSASIAGPGFINIALTDEELLKATNKKADQLLAGKKVLVEYSDPNPFKPLHAGHLYTTLVGDVIARLVEQAGAETIRLNFGGDVGLHAGKSMWAIVQRLGGEKPEKLNDVAEVDRPAWLGECYVTGNNAYEDDEQSKAEIIATNKKVYQLHADNDHDSAFAQIYWACRQWSYDYFRTLYEQLQVHAFDRFIPESEVTPLGVSTVKDQLAKGVFKNSDGAVVFDGEKHGLHTRVFINSEGLPTYEAKDVGLSLTKWNDYNFDESIIITANEQAQYMQVVIKAIEQFAPESASKTRHLTHGVVKLTGGVKMSSRKGNVVTALEILDAARTAGQMSDTATDEQTVLAAVKYAFLKSRLGGDIVYDPAESVALEGNSGPYLQYAHARARSILRKSEELSTESETRSKHETQNMILEKGERTLVRKLAEFSSVVSQATLELAPHHLCAYLYELAQEFNRFYENNKVIGSDREAERLSLVQKYADTLKKGLEILGISAPEKM